MMARAHQAGAAYYLADDTPLLRNLPRQHRGLTDEDYTEAQQESLGFHRR